MKLSINKDLYVHTNFGEKSMWMNTQTGDFLEMNETATYLLQELLLKEMSLSELQEAALKVYHTEHMDLIEEGIKDLIEELENLGVLLKTS